MNNWNDFEFNDPYTGESIVKIGGVTLPQSYISFMNAHNGGEGDIGKTWLVLFPLEELEGINKEYETEECLPGKIIIGSNGGGELYGVGEDGIFFNVPEIIEEEYITHLGSDPEELPERINELWE